QSQDYTFKVPDWPG
ncbi:hypothetical protein, partial [Escherichia coli]